MKRLFEEVGDIVEHLGDEWGHAQPGYMFIVKSLIILALTELFILTAGLYLGLRAGYNGGLLDRAVSGLAPIFSAIPSWFIAILFLFFFAWKSSFLPLDFERYIMDVRLEGGSVPRAYLVGLLLPVLTLVVAMIWEYAFNVRNLVRYESQSEHVLYDRARGLPDRRIMRKLLRTALPSFLTYTTYNFLEILTSVLVVEVIFDVNGIGKLLWWSFRVLKDVSGVNFVYYAGGIYFISILMMLLYFVNAVIMESLYIRLDPRVGRE
ncbi:ABC transporter permease subunit [Palaeococcus ferrophilus]|uniref:ABC transporter permease subunit n=1 Tax=Palaeococcus ferrophilus TaxID=83868 RepID=UPI0006975B99|nr:ABC transporter permease subunit [Palaeococcus ferrophilus]